jgi:hypothetical protein
LKEPFSTALTLSATKKGVDQKVNSFFVEAARRPATGALATFDAKHSGAQRKDWQTR